MRRQKRKPMSEINVVPYIDVMLVLLVIFMITAPMLTQGVNVDLPKTTGKTIEDNDIPLIVSVDKKGRYYLSTEGEGAIALSRDNLLIRVKAELKLSALKHKEKTLLVRGDKTVTYGKVVTLMSILKQAGVVKLGLMTKTPAETTSLTTTMKKV
jgi:biopolymer transport protein TolR